MDWTPIQSRLLSSVAYDAGTRTLFVKLRNRAEKRYRNIEPETVDNLLTAESPGFFYSCYIANGSGEETDRASRRAPAFGKLAAIVTIACVFLFTADMIRHTF